MPTRLTLKKVHAISVVDVPASIGADIILTKRGTMCADCKSGNCKKHVKKSLSREEAVALADTLVTAIEKAGDTAESIDVVLDAELAPADADAADDLDELEDDDLMKTADPRVLAFIGELQKRQDEADRRAKESEARVAKMVAEKERAEAVTVAKGMAGDFDVDAVKLADVIQKLDDAGRAVVADILVKANAIAKNSGLLRTPGSDAGADATSPMAQINKKAEELMSADSKLSRPAAIAKALASNPKLYT